MTDERLSQYWTRLQNAQSFPEVLEILKELVNEVNA